MIPVYGNTAQTRAFFDTIPRGMPTPDPMNTIYAGLRNQNSEKDEEIEQPDRPTRMQKFGQALEKAAAYKQQKELDAEVGKEKDKDNEMVGPKGFKIGSDSTVVTGYRDPGFKLAGVQGRSLLGPIGAGVGIFNPALGKGISAVGSLTGL